MSGTWILQLQMLALWVFLALANSRMGGDFYNYEPINGKSVLVRFSIWRISPDAAQSEQVFSGDGGKTWEVNWINKYTRVTEE